MLHSAHPISLAFGNKVSIHGHRNSVHLHSNSYSVYFPYHIYFSQSCMHRCSQIRSEINHHLTCKFDPYFSQASLLLIV